MFHRGWAPGEAAAVAEGDKGLPLRGRTPPIPCTRFGGGDFDLPRWCFRRASTAGASRGNGNPRKCRTAEIRTYSIREPWSTQATELVAPEIPLAPTALSKTFSWLGTFFSLNFAKECLDFSLLSLYKPPGDMTNFSWGLGYSQKGSGKGSDITTICCEKSLQVPRTIRNDSFLGRPTESLALRARSQVL